MPTSLCWAIILSSSFVASSDGHGGTAIVDPVLTSVSQQAVLTQPPHA